MRICIITPELAPYGNYGGIGTHVLILARGLARRGNQVAVAGCRIHGEARVRHEWGESISFSGVPEHPAWPESEWPGALRAALGVRRFLNGRRGEFDIVEISNWPGHGAFLPDGFRCVVRLSSPAREGYPPSIRGRLTNMLERQTCRRARLLLANSEAMRGRALDYYRCARIPSAVVPYGVPDLAPATPPAAEGGLRLLYIGRAEYRKGADTLLAALARALPRCPELRMRFIGADFDDFRPPNAGVRALWRELNTRYSGRLISLGRVGEQEKHEEIASAHWLVVPSRFESFGLVTIEGMRAGTPILAARAGSLEEVCGKGPGNRFFEPAGGADSLAALIEEMHTRGPAYAVSLRAATRAAYLAWFTDDVFVDGSLEHFRRLAES